MAADPKKLGVTIAIGGRPKGAPPAPPFGDKDEAEGGDPASTGASPQAYDPMSGEPCPTCGWGHMPPASDTDEQEPDADDMQGAGLQGPAPGSQYGR